MGKIIVYDDANYSNVADYVECNHCGKRMLLPCGADKCPECGEEGMLEWADLVFEDNQEVIFDDFVEDNKDDIMFKNNVILSEEEYLMKETIDEIANN